MVNFLWKKQFGNPGIKNALDLIFIVGNIPLVNIVEIVSLPRETGGLITKGLCRNTISIRH
jgi:hypothetical protein